MYSLVIRGENMRDEWDITGTCKEEACKEYLAQLYKDEYHVELEEEELELRYRYYLEDLGMEKAEAYYAE